MVDAQQCTAPTSRTALVKDCAPAAGGDASKAFRRPSGMPSALHTFLSNPVALASRQRSPGATWLLRLWPKLERVDDFGAVAAGGGSLAGATLAQRYMSGGPVTFGWWCPGPRERAACCFAKDSGLRGLSAHRQTGFWGKKHARPCSTEKHRDGSSQQQVQVLRPQHSAAAQGRSSAAGMGVLFKWGAACRAAEPQWPYSTRTFCSEHPSHVMLPKHIGSTPAGCTCIGHTQTGPTSASVR